MNQEAPAFGLQMTKLVGPHVPTFRTRVEERLGKSAPARLAHAIVEQHGIRDDRGVLVPLRLSQGDPGKLVGLTRERVDSILHVWSDQGLVELDRRTIPVGDPSGCAGSAEAGGTGS